MVIVHMGSSDIIDFIAGQQRNYYFIRKSCWPLQLVAMDPQGSMDPS